MKRKFSIMLFAFFITLSTFAQSYDYDMSLIPYRSGDKWGFATPGKQIVITPKYNDVDWFSEGYAAVKVGTKWGYINKDGKMVIPAKFTVAKPFRKGFIPKANDARGDSILFAGASVQSDGYEICINTKGTNLGKCPAISEEDQNAEPDGYILQQKTYSLPNSSGLFDKIEDDYKVNGETYYIARKGNDHGVFNTKFETIVPFQYTSIRKASANGQDYLVVNKYGTYGLLDANGKEIMPLQYSSLNIVDGNMKKGYVIVNENGRSFVKGLDGANITNRGYGNITYDPAGGFVLTGDNNLKGFYFTDNTYISPKYTRVQLMPGGKYLKVRTFSGDEGYINAKGEEYFVQ